MSKAAPFRVAAVVLLASVGLGTASAQLAGLPLTIEFIAALDANEDGQVGLEEIQAVWPFIDATLFAVVDVNDDGVIDDLDLTILATHWQMAGGHGEGDANDDGFVDDLDLTALATEWPSGDLDASVVPEPATLSLLVLGGVALLRRNRR